MGSLFLATWISAIYGGRLCAQTEKTPTPTTILPPDERPRTPPKAPARTPEEASEDAFAPILQRRQERLDKANTENASVRKEPISIARQVEKLKKEKGEGNPSTSFMAVTPVFVRVTTTGSARKKYSADITGLFHWATRLNSSKNFGNLQSFAGFRLAPLTGAGSYQGVPGRYGFTYFGPMIGLGNIRPPGDEDVRQKTPLAADEQPEFASGFRSGVLWTAGMALTTRRADTGAARPKGEFENKSLLLDGTGLWTEFSYEALFYETMALRGLVGLQTGNSKAFTYAGIGFGLWM